MHPGGGIRERNEDAASFTAFQYQLRPCFRLESGVSGLNRAGSSIPLHSVVLTDSCQDPPCLEAGIIGLGTDGRPEPSRARPPGPAVRYLGATQRR